MKRSNKFSPELRERAVRTVQEHRGESRSLWAAIESIAPKIGCVLQMLLNWVKQAEIDAGARPGVSTAEAQRIKELEREVEELRRGNEILKLASALFHPSGDRPPAEVMCGLVDEHREVHEVEPICAVPQIAPSGLLPVHSSGIIDYWRSLGREACQRDRFRCRRAARRCATARPRSWHKPRRRRHP